MTDIEGKGLENNLNKLGIHTHYINRQETPQGFRFNFSGGYFTDNQLKRAVQILHNYFGGYQYEMNPKGGFTITRYGDRQFINIRNTFAAIKEKTASDTNWQQKCYLCFGKGADGYVTTNFDEAVHILVAGSAGSGKSCLLNSLIMQALCYSNADLILIDPKNGAEFGIYEQDVHNRIRAIAKNTTEAVQRLQWAVDIMEQRYAEMGRNHQKKYEGNRIIVVIDELADLMMTSKSEVEDYIIRIAQKGRAAAVHLIVATQDPRAQVVTGLIKYNLPTKVCLKTANARHSMNVIDCGKGAELLDKGDGYVIIPSSPNLQRVQCPYITDENILELITKRTV